ncbi:hypothetical protein N8628_04260 [Verrucomicrobia bacterium]|nr:hypothetical protein [Verrucomicrobiota bacterium]
MFQNYKNIEKIQFVLIFIALSIFPLGSSVTLNAFHVFIYFSCVAIFCTPLKFKLINNSYLLMYSLGFLLILATSFKSGNYQHSKYVIANMFLSLVGMYAYGSNKECIKKGILCGISFSGVLFFILTCYTFGFQHFIYLFNGVNYYDEYILTKNITDLGMNSNAIGLVYLSSSISSILLFFNSHDNKNGNFYLFNFYIFMMLCVLSGSNRVLVPAILICFALYIHNKTSYKKHKLNKIWRLPPTIALAFLIWNFQKVKNIFVIKSIVIFQLIGVNLRSTDDFAAQYIEYGHHTRHKLITEGIDLFLENPIFGLGIENSRLYMHTYTHFDFLELVIGGGIFCGIIFYSGYFIIAKKILMNYKINASESLIYLLIFTSILILGFAGGIYKLPWIHIVCFAICEKFTKIYSCRFSGTSNETIRPKI